MDIAVALRVKAVAIATTTTTTTTLISPSYALKWSGQSLDLELVGQGDDV